jgi:sugar/nucleoside kinase (ribokinase family)
VIALLGNLARDVLPGKPPRVGGGPFHGARALRRLRTPALIVARCAVEDREELFSPVVRLGSTARFVAGTATACFSFSYEGDRRRMRVEAVGDVWSPEDVPALPDRVQWVHVAPLLRSDFPVATLAAIGKGRRVMLDGQGLVRVPRVGPLELDADFDPEALRHVWAVKLSEEEAEVLGDPGALPIREVLVTHGSRGVTIHTRGVTERVPARPIGTSDPTGAGDAFCISYVEARANGLPPASAARRAGALVAALLAAR